MNLTDRAVNAFKAFTNQNTETTKNSSRGTAAEFLNNGSRRSIGPITQDWSQVEMSDQDMYTGYSYAAIKKRANRASALGKKFLFTDAAPSILEAAKKAEKDVEHPYLELIRKSKDFSRRKFWHDISVYLDLEGVYYLMAVRAIRTKANGDIEVGAVQSFQMLNPYEVKRVVRQSDGTLGGYIESKGGTYREIPKEMIIEVRLLNPFDNDKAYSMTDAAKESQFTLKQAGDYTRHSIRGNINAQGIVTTGVELDDDVFDNFVSRMQNHNKGEPVYGNGAGALNWESMQINLDDAGLDKINEINRAVLFAVSGTSKTTLGIEESGTTRDTSQTQKDNFTEDSVMPQVEDILDALNLDYRRWYSDWETNEYEITLDNPLATDREAELSDIEIRQSELDMRDALVAKGYEYSIAARYAHGEITLEELGEPTLEPELTDEQAAAEAAKRLGQAAPATSGENPEPEDGNDGQVLNPEDSATAQGEPTENRYVATNKFVDPKVNEKKIKAAMKDLEKQAKEEAAAPKIEDDKLADPTKDDKAVEEAEKDEAEESEDDSEEIIEDEEDKKKADPSKKKKKKTRVVVEMENAVKERAINQVSVRDDFPTLYDDLQVDPRAVNDDKYRGCIMMNTEIIPVLQFVKNGEQDLVNETTRHDHTMGAVSEIEPHTTLLYGLMNNGNTWKDKVDTVLSGWEMPTVTINEVSFFQLEDSKAIVGLLEETPELIDANQRLSLLPHLNTFSEYHPHITLAYITDDADVDKWVNTLGKKYNGQKVATTGLNYGDAPADDTDDDEEADNHVEDEHPTTPEEREQVEKILKKKIYHDHDHDELVENRVLEAVTNALEPVERDSVLLENANLTNAVRGLERDVVNAVLEALRNGDIDKAENIIEQANQEEGGHLVATLGAVFAAYYTATLPLYAAMLLKNRLSQFNKQGVFAMTDDVKADIKRSSQNAAESHVTTVMHDLETTLIGAQNEALRTEMIKQVNDGIARQDEAVISKLPAKPTEKDIAKAVDSGKFDDQEIYKTARDNIRKGEGLNNIVKALTTKYARITETRAKTIANHESSRVFNMSQYQADVQFLTETNNMSRAYKRLKSRRTTGHPCPVCSSLIEKTRLHPIPFEKNFADLGETLHATYTKENGVKAVQKVPINYEAIKAGNIHVNCHCEYELVIKNDNGSFSNELDGVFINAPIIDDHGNLHGEHDGKFTKKLSLSAAKLKIKGKMTSDKVNVVAAGLKGTNTTEMRKEVFDTLGFNDLPQVTDKPLTDYFSRYETGDMAEAHKLDIMYEKDRYIPETQILGSGTYFSHKEDSVYKTQDAVQVKADLDHTANVGTVKEVDDMRKKLMGDADLSTQSRKLIADYGTLGALMGYDALDNGDIIVVMNRSKLIIEDLGQA